MPAPTPRAASVREGDALLRVLEAYIETLQAENEFLKRRLAAETRAAQETTKVEEAIAEKKANAVIAEIETAKPPIHPPPPKRRRWPRVALLGRWEAS